MSELKAIADMIEAQTANMAAFKARHTEKVEELSQQIDEIAVKINRPFALDSISSQERSPNQKAIGDAIRALFAGDKAKADSLFLEAKGMSAGIEPDGGYVVLPEFSSQMTTIMGQISPMARIARTIEMKHGLVFEEVVDKEQAAAAWVSELQTRNDTATPNLGLFKVEVAELCAMPKASQSLIDGANINIVQWLQAKVAESFAVSESKAFHSGTGVGQPRGLLTYPTAATGDGTRAWGTIEHVATGASGAFPTASATVNAGDVLVDLVSKLKAQYRIGAVWLMNRTTAAAVRKLKDADGRHIWVDSLTLGNPSTLLGYPVEISEDMPDIGANALAIAFGNFKKAYTIVRRLGVRFLTDPFTDKPNVRLYSYCRVGGAVNNTEAIKFLKFAQ